MSQGKQGWIGLILLLFLTLAAYSNTFNASFHYDDSHSIVYNPHVRNLSDIPRYFYDVTMTSGYQDNTGGYRPLLFTSLAINYAISRLQPWSYHVANLIFHFGVVTGVFLLTLFFFDKKGLHPSFALVPAGVFALHPTLTEAVTYIIARTALLCTFFYVLSFYFYVRFRDSDRVLWLAACIVSFMTALFSKELAYTLPLMALAYEFLIIPKKDRNLSGKLILWVVLFLFLAFRFLLFSHSGKEDMGAISAGNLAGEPRSLVEYIRLFLLPINLNFFPVVSVPDSIAEIAFILPAAIVAAIISLVFILRKKNPHAAFGLAWLFIALLPETFANLRELTTEYRLYLPAVGLVLFVSAISAPIARLRPYYRYAAGALVIVLLALFAMLSFERNKVYKDDITLWEDTAKKSPASPAVHVALGEAYLRSGRYEETVTEIEKAFSLGPFPGIAGNLNNMGQALFHLGRYDEALNAYQDGLRLEPDNKNLLANMGILFIFTGRYDEAAKSLEHALKEDPEDKTIQLLLTKAQLHIQ